MNLKKFILYENSKFLILNKPAGLLVHSGKTYGNYLCNDNHDLLKLLLFNRGTFKLYHRLDKDTSGCILVIKADMCFDLIKNVRNVYHCVVFGLFKSSIIINVPIKVGTFCFFFSKTLIIPLKYLKNKYTVLKIIPLTGRKHQIRVHLSSLKYPIIGDDKYGNFQINRYFYELGLYRLFLHKSCLSFEISGKLYMINAPYDNMFQFLLSV